LSEEQSTSVIHLPPSNGRTWRPAWALMLLLGLCMLPIYQSAARYVPQREERAGPTQKVVDALKRSTLPLARTPTLAPAPAGSLIAPLEETTTPTFASMLQMAGKPLFLGPTGDRERAVDCLALAAWYEAGNDVESQRSVVQVVLNRVAHPSFPKSVCGVVFQGSQRTTGCQFTFTCDGSMLRRQPSPTAMARARAVAELALQGAVFTRVMQATHYHADYVQPWWSSHLIQRGRVGRHIFYTWPGKRGVLPGRPSSAGEAGLAQLVRQNAGAGTNLPGPGDATEFDPATAETQLAVARPTIGEFAPAARTPKPGDAIFLAVDRSSPSGRWAVSALGKCAGKAGCRVLGYESQDQITRNTTIPAAGREKPVFLFVRDAASGIELALWDCDKVQRPASNQCLPNSGRELTQLLRDNQN
jgi:spore germination cell wall hydrolase CwlJ-like protein